MKRLNILLHSDQNIETMTEAMDGLTSLVQMIAGDEKADVHILTKCPCTPGAPLDVLLEQSSVKTVTPDGDVSPENVTDTIMAMDRQHAYDVILINGKDSILSSMDKPYVNKVIPYVTAGENWYQRFKSRSILKQMAGKFTHILTETATVKEVCSQNNNSESNVREAEYLVVGPSVRHVADLAALTHSYTMAFDLSSSGDDPEELKQLLQTFHYLKKLETAVTLCIVGQSTSSLEMADQLHQTPGVLWNPSDGTDDGIESLNQSDIGYVSKGSEEAIIHQFLTYAALGKAVVLPGNKLTRQLLGDDYPLFAKTPKEAAIKTQIAFNDTDIYQHAASVCFHASLAFDEKIVRSRLMTALWAYNKQKPTILFTGHDFKFLKPYIQSLRDQGLPVLVDKWQGHERHDPFISHILLEQADIVFCEWGLGNAEFYSANIRSDQRLYIRVHRQELETNYLERVNFDNVTHVIAISAHTLEAFVRLKQVPRSKMKLIPNMMDVKKFAHPKTDMSRYHLGIVGIVPKLKRIDRAVDILEKLWERDHRFKLFIKGKLPGELSWMKQRKEEMAYYNDVFARIEEAPWKENVVFSGFGNDMEEWFEDIGFTLSTSDLEGFHLGPMEGIASGAFPVIFDREGVASIYPPEVIVKDVDEAVERIWALVNEGEVNAEAYMPLTEKYDEANVIHQLNKLVFGNEPDS
ncbi:MAG TPA: glycosyltransferase family 4 protein [Bacillota bacterium]|nr:glycosyltransferase family 4 protein [Bacillota bacterium]